MSQMLHIHKKKYLNNPFHLAIFSGLLTLITSIIFLKDGIELTPDGWAYWEGSVSLLNGQGYVYFGGQPITAFAPLFSVYLAGIQKIFGVSGRSLVLGVVLLGSLTSAAWTALFSSLSNPESCLPYQQLLFPIYVSLFVTFYYRFLLSETLFLFLLALLFISLSQLYRQRRQKQPNFRQTFLPSLLLTLLLFSRNSALVFVPAVVLALFLIFDDLKPVQRVLQPLLVGLFALGAWIGLRQLLAQNNSHPFQWAGKYTSLDYIIQMSTGLANLFGPPLLGINWLMLFLIGFAILWLLYMMLFQMKSKSTPQQAILIHILAITLISGGGLYGLFNLTYINDPLSDRFLWFFGLGIIGVLAAGSTWLPKSKAQIFLLSILLIVSTLQAARTTRLIILRIQGVLPPSYAAQHHTIRANYVMGAPIREGNLTIVAPPAYDWLERDYSEKRR